MAGNIKGITIQLGADTTKLSTALSSADKAIRNTQKQLTDVNKALKFDPGNTNLLADKQKLLGDRVTETKQKLDALQKAQDALDAQGVDHNSEEYQQLQQQIDITKSKLKGLEDAQNQFGSVGAQKIAAVGSQLKDVGGKITDVGSTLTKGLTAPIVGVGTASAAAWKEVDDGMDTVAVKTGATGDALTDMQNRAQNIAKTIPTDFQTAGDAVGEVNTRFGLTGQSLEDLSTQFIEFANINNTDVSSSVDSVQKTLSAFGLSSKDAGAMLDTLNKVGQDTGIDMGTLTSTLVANGASFRELGFSASDAANLIGQVEKSGVNVNDVMTGLKKAMTESSKTGKSMQEVLTEAFSSSANASDIFGSKAGPGLYNAMQSGILSMDMFTSGTTNLNDALGSTSDAYNETLDPADKLTTAMNNLKATGADLFSQLQTMLAPVIDQVVQKLQDFNQWFEKLSPQEQQTIIKIAGIVAAIGPLLMVGGKMLTGIGQLMMYAPMIQLAFSALAGPIGIAVAAIAGIIAVGVLLFKNWDKIKAKAQELGNNIKQKWNDIKSNTTKAWNNVKTTVSQKWDDMKSKIANSAIGQTVSKVWDAAKQTTSDHLKSIKSAYDQHGGGMKGAVAATGQAIQNSFTGSYDFIDNLTNGKFSNMVNTVKGKMGDIGSNVSGKLEDVKNHFQNKLSTAASNTQTNLSNISGFFTNKMSDAKNTVSNGLENVKNFFSTKLGAAATNTSTNLSTIGSYFTNKMSDAKNTVSTSLENVKNFFSTKLGSAANTASSKLGDIANAASTKMGSMKEAIRNGLDNVTGFFRNLHWELPKIKLPHFSIKGKLSLDPPSIPTVGVDWYDKGGIFSSPTVIGVGEKRPEFVGALDDLRSIVREESGGGSRADALLAQTVTLLTQLVKQGAGVTVNQNIYANETSYSEQQKQASRNFKEIARELI